MFNDSDNGQTQYCEECQKWAEKCEQLENAIEEIKMGAVYGFANSKHFLHNIFEEIIKICDESRGNE